MVILTTFTALGQTVLPFSVPLTSVVAALATATATEVVAVRRRTGRLQLPLSAAVTGLSLGLLLRSPHPVLFVVAAAAAIASKHLIRTADGRHVLNPSAFGLIVALAASGGTATVTEPSEWGTSGLVALLVCGFGVVVVGRTKRVVMCTTFLVADLALTGALPGPTTLLFAFFMITDPRTAPRALRPSLCYAAALAVLDALISLGGSMVGPYLALVVVGATMPLVVRRAPVAAAA